MNTDVLLPTTEPILYENNNALGAKERFPNLMPSVHLAEYYRKLICMSIWDCILPI